MNLKHLLITVLTGFVLLTGITAFYWAFFDGDIVHKVIEFENPTQLKPEKDTYRPGELVRVYMTFCKYRNVTPTFESAIVNQVLTPYPPRQGTLGTTGCYKDLLVDLETIPVNAHPGTYHFNRVLHYPSNPLRSITVELRTTNFTIN